MSVKEEGNKYRWLLIPIFIILVIATTIFTYKCNRFGTIIGSIGSLASIYAIIEAFVKFKTIEAQTETLHNAVKENIGLIHKKEVTEQVNKYVEAISRIENFVGVRNAEAAIIKIEELQIFIQSVISNPTTPKNVYENLEKLNKFLKRDIMILKQKEPTEPFPKDADCKELIKHFEELRESLIQYSQNIHFSHDKQ